MLCLLLQGTKSTRIPRVPRIWKGKAPFRKALRPQRRLRLQGHVPLHLPQTVLRDDSDLGFRIPEEKRQVPICSATLQCSMWPPLWLCLLAPLFGGDISAVVFREMSRNVERASSFLSLISLDLFPAWPKPQGREFRDEEHRRVTCT